MVVVLAIVVITGFSIAVGTAVAELYMTNKERQNIKTEKELREFEQRELMRSLFNHGPMHHFTLPLPQNG